MKLDYKFVGRRIAEYRKKAGLTQTELADRCGLTHQCISNIESSRSKLSISTFITIANALNVTADALLCNSVDASCEPTVDSENTKYRNYNNFNAIINMTFKEMLVFLDLVYLTGFNNGMYAGLYSDELSEDEARVLLDKRPYDNSWLRTLAEDATLRVFDDNGNAYVTDAFVESVSRLSDCIFDEATEKGDENPLE